MVIASELITALLVAGTLAYLFAGTLKPRGVRTGFFWFFLMIFMITWAGGLWLVPLGPHAGGLQWLPFLAAGLLGALIVSFLAGRRYPAGRRETLDLLERIRQGRQGERMTYLSLTILFWATLSLLLLAVILRYILR